MPAESSLAACVNAGDDDDDGLTNCDDPDCWGFALCAPNSDAGLPPSMPPVVPPEIPGKDDPVGPPPGSMTDSSAPMPVLDSSTPDVPDTGSDAGPPIECEKYCPEGECNADGTCQGPLEFGTFDVASVTVLVPLGREPNLCFDYDYGLECAFSCCPPDPGVSVFLGEEATQEKIVLAPPAENSVEATWKSTAFETNHKVTLREGDLVRFEVFDDDFGAGAVQQIFECSTLVTRGMIDEGMIDCEPADLVPPPDSDHERYFVAAALVPESGTAASDDEDHEADMP